MVATSTSGRGRPRSSQTDRSIRDAALELLRVDGPGAVTIDSVASRSGVARTTIYRRYSSRDDLLAAVLDELVESGVPRPDRPVPDKLRWVLRRVVAVLDDGIGRGGTASVLTDSDPAFTEALRGRLASRLGELAAAMAEDVEAGRLRPGVDPDTLVGLLFGAYLSELLRSGAPRRGWETRTVELLAPAVTPVTGP